MTENEVLAHVSRRIPDFQASGQLERLTLGEVNIVFRVHGTPKSTYPSVILKQSLPYVVTQPDIPLTPERILFEARSLSTFAPQGMLHHLCTKEIRLPHLLDVDTKNFILLMEDIGDVPHLGTWLYEPQRIIYEAQIYGQQIGTFLGQIHRKSYEKEWFATRFNNQSTQQVVADLFYNDIQTLLERANIPDANKLGMQAKAMGDRLTQPGRCLIMGDLWPRALLIHQKGIRVIDWEMAHYGQPCQDVAHFAAHLWMHIHCAPTTHSANCVQYVLRGFLQGYQDVLGKQFSRIFNAQQDHDSSLYFAIQILLHAIGPLQKTYLYDGLQVENTIIQEAIDMARCYFHHPAEKSILALL